MTLSTVFFKLPLLTIVVVLTACGLQQTKKSEPEAESLLTYVDSTQYFADMKGSISMRATFNNHHPSGMVGGYKFQIRSITSEPDFLNSISIVAGGRRIFLEEGQIVLPEKGVTLSLSQDESQYIASFPSALIQFKHNNSSYIYTLELHQIKAFSPP